jgi:SAM-dependent methyltransferase
MSQITTGVRKVLSLPAAYDAAQRLLGAERSRRLLCSDHIRVGPGDVVLDVGCGTGVILDHLPQGVRYFGFDLSESYIRAAEKRYGNRGTFACRDVSTLDEDELPKCQVALAIGLLHHLDDNEVVRLLSSLHGRLAPGGRLVTVDPAYWNPQSGVAKFLISRDRGQNVRTGPGYEALVPDRYSSIRLVRRDDLLNVPYTHAIMECSR